MPMTFETKRFLITTTARDCRWRWRRPAGGGAGRGRRGRRFTPLRSARCATPSPAKAARRIRWTASARKLSADDIKQWITHPTETAAKAKSTKKPPMPAKYGSLPAADLDALVAYMQSLK